MREKPKLIRFIREYGIFFAWIVAFIAVAGSLYFSEIAGFIPCTLCWFQRIFMYPLVILLGIAALRDDETIIRYILPLSITGGLISIYHYLEQKVPGVAAFTPCKVGVPCSGEYINWLGFITIPFLALCGFSLITFILLLAKKRR